MCSTAPFQPRVFDRRPLGGRANTFDRTKTFALLPDLAKILVTIFRIKPGSSTVGRVRQLLQQRVIVSCRSLREDSHLAHARCPLASDLAQANLHTTSPSLSSRLVFGLRSSVCSHGGGGGHDVGSRGQEKDQGTDQLRLSPRLF